MNSGKYQIIIDSSSRIFYASFYIQGLMDVFGKENTSFSKKEFKELKREEEEFAFEHYFAFLIQSDTNSKKIVIDFSDPIDINDSAYTWCDVYAKVNYNNELTAEKYHQKTISIAPGFGIKIWNKWQTMHYCISNLITNQFKPLTSYKRYFQDYYNQYNRPKLKEYEENTNSKFKEKNNEKYVFMIASLWKEDEIMNTTNKFRKQFIQSCLELECDLEGGFYTNSTHNYPEGYHNLLFFKPYKATDYVVKTKKSIFVFNTPAVHKCHGWKLGEYLAMGKAIISTPLTNDLPFPLYHSKNIHIVSSEAELKIAIKKLTENTIYTENLECNSKEYYRSYASPEVVITSIFKKAI